VGDEVTVRLATSYYGGFRRDYGLPVRISISLPKWWKSEPEHVRRLTPYGLLGLGDEFAERYAEQPDRIDPDSLAERFADIANRRDAGTLVLLCFEPDPADCHRSQAAPWLEGHGFGPVPEAEAEPPQLTSEVEP
jgi:hypothetical protein